MPPMQRCTTPGCPRRADKGRCDTCRGRQRRTLNHRRDGWNSLYGPNWPAIRLDYLYRHPICVLCGRLAEIPDHHPRGIRLLRKQNVANPHADRYLRALCKACHDGQSAQHEPGGWHRHRDR